MIILITYSESKTGDFKLLYINEFKNKCKTKQLRKKKKKNTYLAGTIVAKVLLIFQQINIRSLIFNDPDELFFIFCNINLDDNPNTEYQSSSQYALYRWCRLRILGLWKSFLRCYYDSHLMF